MKNFLRCSISILIVLLSITISVSAQSDCDLSSSIDASSPEWDRPFAGGGCCSGIGPVGFHVYGPFTVSVSGSYTINSVQDYDGYLFLYEIAFDPNNQTTNFVAGNDDFTAIGISELTNIPLTAGTEYFVVTSAFAAGQFGNFTTTITGPGAVSCGVEEDPIPTMSQWGLMIFGLAILNMSVVALRRKENILSV